MKFSVVASLAMASMVTAQTLADIPSCALTCLNDAVSQSTDCKTTDVPCICKSFDTIQGSAAGCILGACGQDVALQKVLPATKALCANSGGDSGSSSGQKPAPSKTSVPSQTVIPPPPETETPTTAPTQVPTAAAAAVGPLSGAVLLALGLFAL